MRYSLYLSVFVSILSTNSATKKKTKQKSLSNLHRIVYFRARQMMDLLATLERAFFKTKLLVNFKQIKKCRRHFRRCRGRQRRQQQPPVGSRRIGAQQQAGQGRGRIGRRRWRRRRRRLLQGREDDGREQLEGEVGAAGQAHQTGHSNRLRRYCTKAQSLKWVKNYIMLLTFNS